MSDKASHKNIPESPLDAERRAFLKIGLKITGVLAGGECLGHRNSPDGAGQGWYAVAGSFGRGSALSQVYDALLSSSMDRSSILTRRFTHIGTGVARAESGEVYVVLAFMDRTP